MERQVIIPHYYTVRSRLKLSLIENFLIPSARPSEARSWRRCSDTQPRRGGAITITETGQILRDHSRRIREAWKLKLKSEAFVKL